MGAPNWNNGSVSEECEIKSMRAYLSFRTDFFSSAENTHETLTIHDSRANKYGNITNIFVASYGRHIIMWLYQHFVHILILAHTWICRYISRYIHTLCVFMYICVQWVQVRLLFIMYKLFWTFNLPIYVVCMYV